MSEEQKQPEEPQAIEISYEKIVEFLEEGLDRKELAKKFNVTVAEMRDVMASHPNLKHAKPKKKKRAVVLVGAPEVSDSPEPTDSQPKTTPDPAEPVQDRVEASTPGPTAQDAPVENNETPTPTNDQGLPTEEKTPDVTDAWG